MAKRKKRKTVRKQSPINLLIITVLDLSVFFYDALSELIFSPPALPGEVVRVADGETLVLKDNDGLDVKVRLFGIDAPESSQAYGKASTEALKELVAGKVISAKVIDIDQYGRRVCIVEAEGINVNAQMLAEGHAWYYAAYCNKRFCQEWEKLAEHAKNENIGLWKDPSAIPPWEHRKSGR